MEKLSPDQAYVAYAISFWSNMDIFAWAAQQVSGRNESERSNLLLDIAWLNTKQKLDVDKAGSMLEAYVLGNKSRFNFLDFEEDAKQMLSERIRQYIDGTCSPYELCQLVSPIENCFDFPDWLGGLYDACDWCEPNSTQSEFRHLEQTAKEVLDAL